MQTRDSLARSPFWRAGSIVRSMAALVVVSLLLSGVLGTKPTTLCISADGHVDVRVTGEACGGCPTAACQAAGPSGESDASLGEGCCFDIPISLVPIVYAVPKPLAFQAPAFVTQPLLAIHCAPDAPGSAMAGHRLVGRNGLPSARPSVDCLRSIRLLV